MTVYSGKDRLLILLGDIVLFYLALFLALFIRYNVNIDKSIIFDHIVPFSLLFVLWGTVFIIGGLYEKNINVIKNRLPSNIFRVQIINSFIAVVFFYSIPYFGIAPKTTLFIYLILSFVFVFLWRIYGYLLLRSKIHEAVFIGSGEEFEELVDELKKHTGYPIFPNSVIDIKEHGVGLSHALFEVINNNKDINIIVADISDRRLEVILPRIYSLMTSGYVYIEANKLYEDVFGRLPVSLLDERWFIKNVSLLPKHFYDFLKRITDLVIASILLVISLPVYLFVYVAMLFDDGGSLFFTHERVGQYGNKIKIIKFRSMCDGKEITKVGYFIRKYRIDELPQLFAVIKGDLSMIGPRPEVPSLVEVYEKDIPYYGLRHMIKPGLSGWAQVKQRNPPKFKAEIQATYLKLSYDLYYLKHRSFILDIYIALQTVKEIISKKGI